MTTMVFNCSRRIGPSPTTAPDGGPGVEEVAHRRGSRRFDAGDSGRWALRRSAGIIFRRGAVV
jgi:hypothetical protein